MGKNHKRCPKWVISTVVAAVFVVALSVALLVTDLFIPVKYLTAYFVSAEEREEGAMRVTFLNMDFGDSALVEFPDGKVMLIDGGDGAYPHVLSLIRFLNSRGVDTIDYLVCTSVKDEHCGGLAEIVRYKQVALAYIPYCQNTRITDEYHAFVTALRERGVPTAYACVGEGYADEENGCFFTFLSPTEYDSPLSEYRDLNAVGNAESIENASVVTWIQYGQTAFAFTSDARAATLQKITEDYRFCSLFGQPYCPIGAYEVRLEECDVVTVAAHGAENNTSALWYDAIRPEQAVLSVGKNFVGCPSLQALADVCAYTKPLYTSEKGNVVIRATGESYTVLN